MIGFVYGNEDGTCIVVNERPELIIGVFLMSCFEKIGPSFMVNHVDLY